jgi:hypothetical protein
MLDGKPDENSLVYLIPRSEIIRTIHFEPLTMLIKLFQVMLVLKILPI